MSGRPPLVGRPRTLRAGPGRLLALPAQLRRVRQRQNLGTRAPPGRGGRGATVRESGPAPGAKGRIARRGDGQSGDGRPGEGPTTSVGKSSRGNVGLIRCHHGCGPVTGLAPKRAQDPAPPDRRVGESWLRPREVEPGVSSRGGGPAAVDLPRPGHRAHSAQRGAGQRDVGVRTGHVREAPGSRGSHPRDSPARAGEVPVPRGQRGHVTRVWRACRQITSGRGSTLGRLARARCAR